MSLLPASIIHSFRDFIPKPPIIIKGLETIELGKTLLGPNTRVTLASSIPIGWPPLGLIHGWVVEKGCLGGGVSIATGPSAPHMCSLPHLDSCQPTSSPYPSPIYQTLDTDIASLPLLAAVPFLSLPSRQMLSFLSSPSLGLFFPSPCPSPPALPPASPPPLP